MKAQARALSFALALALSLALALPASALSADSFSRGRLSGITAAIDGSLLVTDVYNKVVWQVKGDAVSRFAGAISVPDASGEPVAVYHDGAADKAYFMEPWDIVPFLDGYAVSDTAANVIRYVTAERVMTLAGSGKAGSADGSSTAVSFNRPTGLAVDENGTLYVADSGNGAIRVIDTKGSVTTAASGLAEPTGLCWYDGSLYIAETGRSRICRMTNGQVQPVAGISTSAEDSGEFYGGYADGPAAGAKFDHPQDVAVGTDGTIYVADAGNSAVRAIHGDIVCTLARSAADTPMPASPCGLLVSGSTLYAADRFAGNILTLSVARKSYSDVDPGVWYADAADMMDQLGVITGTSSTAFEPNTPTSRAMVVTMLSRLHRVFDGNTVIDGNAAFADVPESGWYSAAVRWAADAGVVSGMGDGTFAPNAVITREQAARMLYQYALYAGKSVNSAADLSVFADADSVSPWATDAMRWAVGAGLIGGKGDNILDPQGSATRAEIATIFMRYCLQLAQ